jgi:hypothetical protein
MALLDCNFYRHINIAFVFGKNFGMDHFFDNNKTNGKVIDIYIYFIFVVMANIIIDYVLNIKNTF